MVLSEPLSTITVCVLTRASKNLKYVRLSDNHLQFLKVQSSERTHARSISQVMCTDVQGSLENNFSFSFVLFLFRFVVVVVLFIYLSI